MAPSATNRGDDSTVPVGYIEITGQASELVKTGDFSNVTIGPVAVRRLIPDTFDLDTDDGQADLKREIENVQVLVEHVISEQRGLVEDSLEFHAKKS